MPDEPALSKHTLLLGEADSVCALLANVGVAVALGLILIQPIGRFPIDGNIPDIGRQQPVRGDALAGVVD